MRYALGQFDLDLKDLSYPSLADLYQSKGEAEKGMVVRFLRSGWVFIYTEEGAACEADKTHTDAAPSHDGDWHIYYYYSPDDGGDIGGKFVKYKWSGGAADKGEWKVYKNDNQQPVTRDYIVMPCSVSKIYIAYSQHIWSLHMFSTVKGSDTEREKYMQLVSIFPTGVQQNVAPLLLLNDSRPSKAQLKETVADELTFTPEILVKELSQANAGIEYNSKEFKPNDNLEFLLGSAGLSACNTSKVQQIRSAMHKKAEIGVIIGLHDPIGIAGDLGSFHTSVTLESLGDITENTYAYTTYQAIESQLGAVLPNSKHPFAVTRQKNKLIVDMFDKKVKQKVNEKQSKPFTNNPAWVEDVARKETYNKLSDEDKKALLDAHAALENAKQQATPLEKAKEALADNFFSTRKKLIDKSVARDKEIEKLLAVIKNWLKGTGQGSISRYFQLLEKETQSTINADQLTGVHNLLGSIATTLENLQSSRPGRVMLAEIMFGKEENKGLWVTHVLPFATAASKSSDWSEKAIARFVDQLSTKHTSATHAMQTLQGALHSFYASISGTNALSNSLLSLYKSNAKADPLSALPALRYLFSLESVRFDVQPHTLEEILATAAKDIDSITGWNASSRAKLFGKLTSQSMLVPTINGQSVDFDVGTRVSVGFNGVVGFVELFLYGMNSYMIMSGMERISQSDSLTHSTAIWLKSNIGYQVALFADNIAKIFAKNIDTLIAKNAALVINKTRFSSAVISSNLTSKAQSLLGTGKFYTGLTKLAKIGPALGLIDMISNTALAISLGDRGDYDAAAYAATGAVGGAAMIAFTVLAGPIAWAFLGVGVLLTVVGMVGLSNNTDGDLERWVKDSFWGGKPSKVFGLVPEYYYWNEVERDEIEAKIKINGKKTDKHDAQIAISRLLHDSKYCEVPANVDINVSDIGVYFKNEMDGLNNYRYMPNIQVTDTGLMIYLPSFIPATSYFNLKYIVNAQSGSYRDGTFTKSVEEKDLSYPEKEGNFYWEAKKQLGLFVVTLPSINGTSILNKGYLEFSYYPEGINKKGKETPVIPSYYKDKQLITKRRFNL